MGPLANSQTVTESPTSRWDRDLAFIAERLSVPAVAISSENDARLLALIAPSVRDGPPVDHLLLKDTVSKARLGRTTLSYHLGDGCTLVVSPLPNSPAGTIFACVLPHSPDVACKLVSMACELLVLQHKSNMQKVQLEAFSNRSARRFEDQRRLRDLARSVAISSDNHSIRSLVQGVLAPVRGLLRAEGLYLLSSNSTVGESHRLPDTKFGPATQSVEEIRSLLEQMGLSATLSPIVLNQAKLLEGTVKSLLVVPLIFEDLPLGILAAINRNAKDHQEVSKILGYEFGSNEMALLEDAGLLLCSQAQNLQYLIETQLLVVGSLRAMSRAIDARDKYTQGHSERVARLAYELAKTLGLSEVSCQEIYIAGILHDIGKIGIPDNVLLKNGPLTDEEFGIIKKHPEIGHQIVEQMGKLQFALPGVLHHHERWDGRGYPHGLRGESTPLMARVLAVADSFDAMTSSRPYRNAMPIEKACEIIQAGSAVQWDAAIVDCFRIWYQRRTQELATSQNLGETIVPREAPLDSIAQSVFALGI